MPDGVRKYEDGKGANLNKRYFYCNSNRENNNYLRTQTIHERTQGFIERTEKESSSYKEHKVNALALGADEGRDKLR